MVPWRSRSGDEPLRRWEKSLKKMKDKTQYEKKIKEKERENRERRITVGRISSAPPMASTSSSAASLSKISSLSLTILFQKINLSLSLTILFHSLPLSLTNCKWRKLTPPSEVFHYNSDCSLQFVETTPISHNSGCGPHKNSFMKTIYQKKKKTTKTEKVVASLKFNKWIS